MLEILFTAFVYGAGWFGVGVIYGGDLSLEVWWHGDVIVTRRGGVSVWSKSSNEVERHGEVSLR
jgi:hypothetical protein